MGIYLFIFLSVVSLSAYNAIMKVIVQKMHYVYVIPFIVAGALIASLFGLLLPKFISFENMMFTKNAAPIAFIAGLVWFLGQLLYFVAFFKTPEVSTLIPIQVGGIAVGGVIMGFLFFKEPLTSMKIMGIMAILFGIFTISRS